MSEWTRRGKLPGERVLCEDRGAYRYYDVQSATEKAKREGWDAAPYNETETAGQRAAKAVDADFRSLKAWCDNEWHWCGIVISAECEGVDLGDHLSSLWGLECNHPASSDGNGYLTTVANELLPEAVETIRCDIEALFNALR